MALSTQAVKVKDEQGGELSEANEAPDCSQFGKTEAAIMECEIYFGLAQTKSADGDADLKLSKLNSLIKWSV